MAQAGIQMPRPKQVQMNMSSSGIQRPIAMVQAAKPQITRQQPQSQSKQVSNEKTDSVLKNLNSLLVGGAESQRSQKELEIKNAALEQELVERGKQIAALQGEHIQFDGKLLHHESLTEQLKTDMETFKRSYAELAKNMDDTKRAYVALAHATRRLHRQNKLTAAEQRTRTAEDQLEKAIPARLKEFQARLDAVKENHATIKIRYDAEIEALKDEVTGKIKELAQLSEAKRTELEAAKEEYDAKNRKHLFELQDKVLELQRCNIALETKDSMEQQLKKDLQHFKESLQKQEQKAAEVEHELRERLNKKEEEMKMTSAAMQAEIMENKKDLSTRIMECKELNDQAHTLSLAVTYEKERNVSLEKELDEVRKVYQRDNDALGQAIQKSEAIAQHMMSTVVEMEKMHQHEQQCKELMIHASIVEKQKEFERGKLTGEKDERASNAVLQKQHEERANAHMQMQANERAQQQAAVEKRHKEKIEAIEEELKKEKLEKERLQQAYTQSEIKKVEAEESCKTAEANALRNVQEQSEKKLREEQSLIREKEEFAAQLLDVTKRYEQEAAKVHTLDGQIKTLKKEIDEYKNQLKQMEKNRKKAEQLEAKKAAEQEAKSLAAALEEARKLKESEETEAKMRLVQLGLAKQKEMEAQQTKKAEKAATAKAKKEEDEIIEGSPASPAKYKLEKEDHDLARVISVDKYKNSSSKGAGTSRQPRHYGKAPPVPRLTSDTHSLQASQPKRSQDAKRKGTGEQDSSFAHARRSASNRRTSPASPATSDKVFSGDFW